MIAEISADKFVTLESEHGEIYEARTGQGIMLFRCPTEDEWVLFERGAGDEKDIEVRKAANKLVFRTVVYPERAELEALLKKRPAMVGVLIKSIADVAKGSEEARAKKPEAPSTGRAKT
jgi:hypothetical protein